MAPRRTALEGYRWYMEQAAKHYRNAEWEDMSRSLEQAEEFCDQPGFPDKSRHKQKIYGLRGAVQRRYGHHEEAARILERALQLDEFDSNEASQDVADVTARSSPKILGDRHETSAIEDAGTIERVEILGELATVYRHMDDLDRASSVVDLQYKLAQRLSWQTDAEVCRAIGNSGMIKYQKALLIEDRSESRREKLLDDAIQDSMTRISLARNLQAKLSDLSDNEEAMRLRGKAEAWEVIGIARLVLCYLEKGDLEHAIVYGERGIERCETLRDPTSRAHARFYHGLALWRAGGESRRAEGKRQFELHGPDERDKCTPAIAFCKEPSSEYRGYLKILIDECRVPVDHYDEQGYSALDYAVFSGDVESMEIIRRGLTGVPRSRDWKLRTSEEIDELVDQAYLRKHCRVILQDYFRPAFIPGSTRSIRNMKARYSSLLERDKEMRGALDHLKYIKWTAFKQHGRLPRFNDGADMIQIYKVPDGDDCEDIDVVFMSYKWLCPNNIRDPQPDDVHGTQYYRMCDAIRLLIQQENLNEERVGIWLDIACINQDDPREKNRGIAALPLVVVQCTYMVSLVDVVGEYYRRAWCVCEAMLMKTLQDSYHQHRRYEHVPGKLSLSSSVAGLTEPDARTDRLSGIVASEQGLSRETDRAQIRFLERQGRLFGKQTQRIR